jgi:hypothetical protein
MRALEFGQLTELEAKYGNVKKLEEMPKPSITRTAAVFRPHDQKKEILPGNPMKTLDIWKKRQTWGGEDLPDIFIDAAEVVEPNEGIIGRNRLVLKARSTQELMDYTTDDE